MKEDRTGYVIIIVILLITAAIGYQIYKSIKEERSYELAKNGEIFKSNNCYIKEDIAYCEYEEKVIKVDNYYEEEK